MQQENQNKNFINGGQAFFIMVIIYFLATFIGQGLLGITGLDTGLFFYSISGIITMGSIAIVIFLARFQVKRPLFEVINLQKFNPIYIAFALVLSLSMFFGFGFVNDAFIKILRAIGLTVNTTGLTVNTGLELFIYSIVYALLPAVIEESFFRGVMLKGIKGRAILTSLLIGLCFALYHLSFAQFIYQFIYGVSLTFLAIRAKSAIPSMIAHFTNNFLVLLLSFVKAKVDLNNLLVIIMAIALFLLFWVVLVVYKPKKQEKKEDQDIKGIAVKDFWLPYGLIAMVACFAIIVCSLFI